MWCKDLFVTKPKESHHLDRSSSEEANTTMTWILRPSDSLRIRGLSPGGFLPNTIHGGRTAPTLISNSPCAVELKIPAPTGTYALHADMLD